MEEGERVIRDVAEEVDSGFDAPVVVVLLEGGMVVEEATVPAAHVAVRQHPAFADTESAEVVETVHVAGSVNPCWGGPVG